MVEMIYLDLTVVHGDQTLVPEYCLQVHARGDTMESAVAALGDSINGLTLPYVGVEGMINERKLREEISRLRDQIIDYQKIVNEQNKTIYELQNTLKEFMPEELDENEGIEE
jgi:hypothetical protein